jgi:hypothetical protein
MSVNQENQQEMQANFDEVVNRQTVESVGFDMSLWTDKLQVLLRESMILAWKENPDWTEEQAKTACREQAKDILFEWFQEHLGFAVEEANYWQSLEAAFENFLSMPLVDFLEILEEQREFGRFAAEFYDELREMWNICSGGMWDEYQRMKKNKWRFRDYRKWLDAEKRKHRHH